MSDQRPARSGSSLRVLVPALLLVMGVAGLVIGCSSARVVEEGIGSAAEAAGEEMGQAMGEEMAEGAGVPPSGTARYNQVMLTQAQMMFSYAFSAGGMWPAQATYEPGEWTMYRVEASSGETALDTLERAFLKTTEEGNEWWRVRGVQDGERWVYEALLDPEQETVVRLRGRDPEGSVGEVPVTEQTVYRPPQTLTEESVEGATTGTQSLDTPAGTFSARRVEYGGTPGGGTITWFLSEEVPGHVVQYRGQQGEQQWTSTLIDYGSDATTRLDSY